MGRATARLSRSEVEWVPPVVASAPPFAVTAAKLRATRRDGAVIDLRHGVVACLLAKREDSPGVVANGKDRSASSIFRDVAGTVVEFDLGELVRTTIALFRAHPHINNVLTHICAGKWECIGQTLCIVLYPRAALDDLSPLAQNVVN